MLFGLLPLAQKDDHEKGGEHKIDAGGVKGDQPAHQAAQCGPTHPGEMCIRDRYTLAHGDMLRSLENKVQGIYEYVESIAEEEDFTAINRREDEAGAQYRGLKEELERVRKIAGVRYLYTAKQAQDGGFVYLVDGLDLSLIHI